MKRKKSRLWLMIGAVLLITIAMAYAFWPRATLVDMGSVRRAPMLATIDEEAKTRVADAYVVSAPIAGQLMRVEVKPGDAVRGGETLIARMLPANPPPLDIRTREQARTAVASSEASLQVARADLDKARAEKAFTDADLERKKSLNARGVTAQAALDDAERAARAANATLDVAKATITMREADLANARARLISFAGPGEVARPGQPSNLGMADAARTIPLTAPISGRILRVIQESETTVSAGAPILEIGDIANDLEVVVELLSNDAVQVSAGNRVLIRKWGGAEILNGVVERVEPWGFTKTSALGVEEQRVKAIIKFTDPPASRRTLGHGFRVEVQIVIWDDKDALTVPSNALYRHASDWAVFKVENGIAHQTKLKVGRNNGTLAEVLGGIEAGATVILYPGPSLIDGAKVASRNIRR